MKQLVTLTLLVCSLFAKGQIQQQSSFETALPSGWQAPKGGGSSGTNYSPFGLIEASETWSAAISNTYKVSGNTSWRGEVRPGDREVFYGNPRQEISLTSKGTAPTYQQNTFRISTLIPTGAWASSSAEEVFPFQFHPHPITGTYTGGSPSLAIEIKNDRYRIMGRNTAGNTSTSATQVFYTSPNGVDIGPVVRGAWVHWIVYYVPSPDANGRIVIWRKTEGVDTVYKQIYAYSGDNVHAWSKWPFLKVGVYKWNNPASGAANTYRTYYMDMVAFGKATEATAVSVFSLAGAPPAPNQPPVVSVTNDSYSSGTTGFALNANVTDPENQSMTYLWTQTAGGSVILNNATTKAASVTGATDNQTYSFQFRATDAQGGITTVSKNVSIAAAPVPPTVTMGSNQTITEGTSTATISATATGTLTGGSWTQSSGPTTATIASPTDGTPNTSSTALSNLAPGTYTFKYEVISSASLKASGTVNVFVPTVNAKPQVQPAPPIVYVRSGNSGVIGCIPTDTDGPKPTVLWVQSSGPNTSTITNPTSDTTTVTGLIVGTYTYTVVGTDNKGATGSALVTVQVNNPPVVDSFPGAVFTFSDTTTQVTVTGAAHDPDGSLASYLWSAYEGPTTPTFSPDNTLSTTITNLSTGSYSVMLTVTDNDGVSSSMIYSFTIQARYLIQKFGVKKVLKH